MTYSNDPPPRNYFTVPEGRPAGKSSPPKHDQLDRDLLTGAFELQIYTLAPVHVGSGGFVLFNGHVCKDVVRRKGHPVIPGSTLKGICRQTYEVLTGSPGPGTSGSASPADALFGALGFQGRLSFDDAAGSNDLEPIEIMMSVAYSPRKKLGRRFYGRQRAEADQPKLLPALAIPGQERLIGLLRVRNVRKSELGGIFLALGIDGFHPKVGGGKYDPFGWVSFRLARYQLYEGLGSTSAWVEDPEKVATFKDQSVKTFKMSKTGEQALEDLKLKLKAPKREQTRNGKRS